MPRDGEYDYNKGHSGRNSLPNAKTIAKYFLDKGRGCVVMSVPANEDVSLGQGMGATIFKASKADMGRYLNSNGYHQRKIKGIPLDNSWKWVKDDIPESDKSYVYVNCGRVIWGIKEDK